MIDPSRIWLPMARRVCRKVNFGRWLDHAAVPLVVVAGACAGLLLMLRHHAPENVWALVATAILPAGAIAWSWHKARKEFITEAQALVRLDVHHHLHSALSTAYLGIGSWPPAPPQAEDGLRWRWARAVTPPLLTISLIAAAWFVPVTARQSTAGIIQPKSWSMVEESLQTLVQERVVDPESTEDTRKAIEALRQRPQEEWYDHSSIEAGDRIQLSHQREMSALEQRMRGAAEALRQAAGDPEGQKNGGTFEQGQLGDILDGMRAGGMQPNKDLMEMLQEMAGQEGAEIDPEQLQQLLEQLQKNSEMLEQLLKEMQNLPEGFGEGGEEGEGEQDGDGNPGGAPQRGPGEGGELFGEAKDPLEAPLKKPLPASDLSRAALGDVLGVGEAQHEVDPNDSPALRAGGGPTQAGDGGGAVWSDSLLPDEQEALRRYFE